MRCLLSRLRRTRAVEIVDAGHLDGHVNPGTAVAVVLAQMQHQPVARDPHEQWGAFVEGDPLRGRVTLFEEG